MNPSSGRAPSPDDRSALRAMCERLANEAGAIALRGLTSITTGGRFHAATKSSHTDLVTEYDQAAEEHLVTEIRKHRPLDGIVGEEGTSVDGSSGWVWYLDPIDGTTNFVYGQPAWSSSVAVAHDGEMIAGAVAVPILNESYSAALGQRATCNGHTIRVNTISDLSLALAGTGFSYDPGTRVRQAQRIVGLIDRVRDIRRLGSAAFDLCMVASGRLDLYFEQGLNSWDAAAGELIAREAGAISSRFDGGAAEPGELLVAAPEIHSAAIAALQLT